MYLNIVDSDHRQISLQPRPVAAEIKRNECAKFSSEEEQILIPGVLADHSACHPGWQITLQGFPRLAVVR